MLSIKTRYTKIREKIYDFFFVKIYMVIVLYICDFFNINFIIINIFFILLFIYEYTYKMSSICTQGICAYTLSMSSLRIGFEFYMLL